MLVRFKIFLLIGIMTGACLTAWPESTSWIFEGLVTKADPVLAPDFKSGWVLAGSFLLDPLEMEKAIETGGGQTGRLIGGITEAELTVDLYYQIQFEASQVPGLAGFDFKDNDPEASDRDLIGWFFPVAGRLKSSEWTSTWLQVWLADAEGEMLLTLPSRVPPNGFDWQSAWFRLVFVNAEGQEAYAEGGIEFFLPESAAESDSGTDLANIISDLGSRLIDRDSTIEGLRQDLSSMQDRMDGLRRMVDLLVEERSHLQQENNRLGEQLKLVDPQAQELMGELTSEKALLEQTLVGMTERNQALAGTLAESELKRRLLLDRIADLELASESREAELSATESTISVLPEHSSEEKPREVTVFAPLAVEENRDSVETALPAQVNTRSPESDSTNSSRRQFGPRKFR